MWDKADFVLVGAGDAPFNWWGHPVWSWAMGLHGLFWLVLIGLAIVAIVLLLRSSARSRLGTEISAIAVLDARYARGEIGRGEYMERKRDLA
jgi:putative membrane protein